MSSRIIIWAAPDEYAALHDGAQPVRAGWFDTGTADYWEHPATTSRVWLTPSGRWVYTASHRRAEYLTDDEARAWLVGNGHPQVATDRIDNPPGPGRPVIGPEVKARIPKQVLAGLNAMAQATGVARADLIRTLLTDAVHGAAD
jgi:hypothetical protein